MCFVLSRGRKKNNYDCHSVIWKSILLKHHAIRSVSSWKNIFVSLSLCSLDGNLWSDDHWWSGLSQSIFRWWRYAERWSISVLQSRRQQPTTTTTAEWQQRSDGSIRTTSLPRITVTWQQRRRGDLQVELNCSKVLCQGRLLSRYVPSRLSEHQGMGPARTSEALIDSLDLELNGLGAMNTRPPLPYRSNPQQLGNFRAPALLTQMKTPAYQPVSSNLPR